MKPPLYLKTQYSLLSSMIKVEDLISFALEHQFSYLAIADSNMYGTMEFYKACLQNEIEPILGLEIKIETLPLVLYAIGEDGYHSLLKLSTLMTERSLLLTDLENHTDSLVAVIPYESRSLIPSLTPLFHHLYQGYASLEERTMESDLPFLYFRETLCLKKSDQAYLPYLHGIKTGKSLKEVEVLEPRYIEERDDLSLYPDDFKHVKGLVTLCHVRLTGASNLLPIYPCPGGLDSHTYLKELCKEGLKKRFGERVNKIYLDRLRYEIDVINKMGFCNYFLVVWDYVKYAKEHDILVGPGRGSAAGSLVSYCLFITDVDPIAYQLLFERFLNPERISMPDIDIDFEFNRREEVIQYCISKYGMKRVAQIITFGTLGSKQAIRDVGRVMNIDLKVIDRLCKFLDSRLSLKENYQNNQELKEYLTYEEELKTLYKVALKLEGLKRHTSIHAAGVVMASMDLDEVIPLDKSHGDFYTTSYSMEYLEELGLLKMDFLALRNLTLITDVLKEINEKEKRNLTFDQIPMQDTLSLSLFTEVNTLGIFQFESEGMMNFLRKFRPTSFEDVVAAVALFRPGPMHHIDSYIKRKRGIDPINYLHPDLEKLLKPTYGIVIYQEQVMQIASIFAGYSYGEADVLRRAMSKKKEDIMLKERDQFIKRSVDRGYEEAIATNVYDQIMKFASYGFNRAHSVAYGVIAYKMAYLKTHYASYFFKNLLTMVMGSVTKTREYIYEGKLNHIEILRPDINLSEAVYQMEDFGIRFPLSGIKNLGVNSVNGLLKEREKGKFITIYDFIKRIYKKGTNRKMIESLILVGAFQSFGFNRHTLIENLDILSNYGEISQDLEEEFVEKPELTFYPEYSKKELMQNELDLFGFYLSNHPVSEYKLKYPKTIPLNELERYFDKVISLVVYLEDKKEIETKKKEKMAFFTGSDERNTVDLVFFPRTYQKYPFGEVGTVVHITGKVEKRFDKLQIMVMELVKLE